MAFQIQKLLPRHFLIMDKMLAGMKTKDIASDLGITPQAVSLVTNSPLFQDKIARRRENIEKKQDDLYTSSIGIAKGIMEEAAADAARVHVSLLDSEDEKTRQMSANQILDRVGLPKKEAPKLNREALMVVKGDELDNLLLAFRESREE